MVVPTNPSSTTMHKVDEHAPVEEIRALARIYQALIERYFEAFA